MTLLYNSIMKAFFGTEVKLIVLLSALSLSDGEFLVIPLFLVIGGEFVSAFNDLRYIFTDA